MKGTIETRNFVISLKHTHNLSSNMLLCFDLVSEGHFHGMENMQVCK